MALTLDDFSKILAGDGNQVTDLEKQKAQAILEAYERMFRVLRSQTHSLRKKSRR